MFLKMETSQPGQQSSRRSFLPSCQAREIGLVWSCAASQGEQTQQLVQRCQTLRTLLIWSLNNAASRAANCDGTLIPEEQWLHVTKVGKRDWKMHNCFAVRCSGVLLNQWGKEIQQNPQAYSTRLKTSSKSDLHLWKIEGILPVRGDGLSCWSINSFRRL